MSNASTNQRQTAEARPATISDIIGLKVYTQSGVYLGTVDDIRADFSKKQATGVALTDVNREVTKKLDSQKGVVIPYSWVQSVHDVVITLDILDRLQVNN